VLLLATHSNSKEPPLETHSRAPQQELATLNSLLLPMPVPPAPTLPS
jgi:hypothetical protein